LSRVALAFALLLAHTACSAEVSDPDVRQVSQAITHTATRFSWGEDTLGGALSCAAIVNGAPTASDDIAVTFYHDSAPGFCLKNQPWMLDHVEAQMGLTDGETWNEISFCRMGRALWRISAASQLAFGSGCTLQQTEGDGGETLGVTRQAYSCDPGLESEPGVARFQPHPHGE
jgi:hypothetical protein